MLEMGLLQIGIYRLLRCPVFGHFQYSRIGSLMFLVWLSWMLLEAQQDYWEEQDLPKKYLKLFLDLRIFDLHQLVSLFHLDGQEPYRD